jgi:hypothetical protein
MLSNPVFAFPAEVGTIDTPPEAPKDPAVPAPWGNGLSSLLSSSCLIFGSVCVCVCVCVCVFALSVSRYAFDTGG